MTNKTDGWENLITGLGNQYRDKTLGMTPRVDELTPEYAESLYRSSDMAQRIVDTLPNEMTRAGFKVQIEGDEDASEAIEDRLDTLHVMGVINKALKIARIHGGSAIILGVNDGVVNLAEPLNIEKVESLDFLTVVDSREMRVFEWYNNPFDKNFGLPSMYQLNPRAMNIVVSEEQRYIHASRIIRFEGSEYLRAVSKQRREWPDSILVRCDSVIKQFESAWSSATALMEDYAQAVFKITGLADAISSDKEGLIQKRYEAIDYFRSSRRAIVIDAEKEDFQRTNSQMGGLSDVLQQFALRLAASANMPAALLMGQSPAGLNSTGDAELRWFYDQVRANQIAMLKSPLDLLARLVMQELGIKSDNWCIEFNQLWQPTDKELADVRQQVAQADTQYIANGVLSPDEVAKSRFGGDTYSMDTHVDIEERTSNPAFEDEAPGELPTRAAINPDYFPQITSLITQVAAGQLSSESAIATMWQFFLIPEEQAKALLGPAMPAPAAAQGDAKPVAPPGVPASANGESSAKK
jgi:phage-related protein (TIGR01555 family)